MMLVVVPFLPGNGKEYLCEVLYIAGGFARDQNSNCAFCHGDPCNEDETTDTPIAEYYKDAPWAETCPFCEGRPS